MKYLLNEKKEELVGGLEPWNLIRLSIQLGMSSSQLMNSYFSEGLKPPTRLLEVVLNGAFSTLVILAVKGI